MKKSILIIGLILLIIAVLCVVFYPKSGKKDFPVPPKQEASLNDFSITQATENQNAPTVRSGLKASIDIVRVEEDGSMIAAGKGIAGAVVSLMDGDSVLTQFTVNEDGEWVYIPTEPLVAGEHEIWLQDDSMNTRDETEVVVVSVPEPKNAGEALAVMISPDSEEVSVLQAPLPQAPIDIDIRSINQAEKALIIQGMSRESGQVNVYADNLFLGHAAAVNGEWSLRVSKRLTVGKKYLIRADKIDAFGKVTARVEVPFQMEKGMEGTKRRRVRIVKGDCLWTIAKQLYGSGFAYVAIYQANKNQIKDPDLIYPNQVFVLPGKTEK